MGFNDFQEIPLFIQEMNQTTLSREEERDLLDRGFQDAIQVLGFVYGPKKTCEGRKFR